MLGILKVFFYFRIIFFTLVAFQKIKVFHGKDKRKFFYWNCFWRNSLFYYERRLKGAYFHIFYLISKSTGSVRNWTSKGIFWRLCASSFTWCQKGQFKHACPFIHIAHKFAVRKSWFLTEFKVLLARNSKICISIKKLLVSKFEFYSLPLTSGRQA